MTAPALSPGNSSIDLTATTDPTPATAATATIHPTATSGTAAGNTAATHETAATDKGASIAAHLGVLPWDVATPGTGHDPRSSYVETFWLPLLGPSSILLMRRLAGELERSPAGTELHSAALGREIGLGDRLSRRAPIVRTIDRCVKFHLVLLEGPVLYVRQRFPGLSPRQVARLTPALQAAHGAWSRQAHDGDRRSELVRAAHVAHALLGLGEPSNTVEHQLTRWGISPGVAWNAVHWAQSGSLEEL